MCQEGSLTLLFLPLPSFNVNMMAWVEPSSCGPEATKEVAKNPTWKAKKKERRKVMQFAETLRAGEIRMDQREGVGGTA